MTMPQGSSGTLHDLVSAYAKRSQSVPQLVAMHYAIEVMPTCIIFLFCGHATTYNHVQSNVLEDSQAFTVIFPREFSVVTSRIVRLPRCRAFRVLWENLLSLCMHHLGGMWLTRNLHPLRRCCDSAGVCTRSLFCTWI